MAAVENLRIERGPARFDLQNGRLFFCTPVSGRTCSAVFVGAGRFSYTPVGWMEQEHLARAMGGESLSVSFDAVAFLFADGTEAELLRSLSLGPGSPGRAEVKAVEELLRFTRDPKSRWIDPHLALALRASGEGRMFTARVNPSSGDDALLFSIDPYSKEEVRLSRRSKGDIRTIGRLADLEVVSQCAGDEPRAESIDGDEILPFSIAEELLEARIEDDLGFHASARLRVTSAAGAPDILPLKLFHDLRVDSIRVGGVLTRFCQPEESPTVWVDWTRAPGQGGAEVVELSYGGRLIERVAGTWFTVRSPSGWYPRCASREKALFDITYRMPKDLSFASVGSRIEISIEEQARTERYITTRPIRNASFQVGYFEEYRVATPGVPSVRVLIEAGAGHREAARILGEESGILSGANMEKQVAADIANSARFFTETFGPAVDTLLTAADIPGMHGIAFPGLVNLSWSTFQTDLGGTQAAFRAHEVAHQWWGIGVDYDTYRDRWLSEGFAEFSGLWFMQRTLADNREFFRRMEDSRKAILGARKFLVGKGQPPDPIALGDRVETSTTAGDYNLILYQKGAWVLQMLRNMLLDMDTMKEERFTALMRDFYRTHIGRSASTEDFRTIAEKHAGASLGWFFDEWVYGTGIPRYRFAWKADRQDDGNYLIHCRIEQREVPGGFRMYVPIQVLFEDDRYSLVRVMVKGETTTFDLPLAPEKPRKVILNPLTSVLCEVDEVKW